MQRRARFVMLWLSVCLAACQAVPEDVRSHADAVALINGQASGRSSGATQTSPGTGQAVVYTTPSTLLNVVLRSETMRGLPILMPVRALRFFQEGIASWYGRRFHGRRTANGERYDMYALTAAHRTLPLGVRVRVTNQASGRSVVVRINDRGPYVRGRIIDLSMAAANALGVYRTGTAHVVIEGLQGRGASE